MPIGFIWQTFLETPLINLMVLLSVVSFGSYGIAILLFTLLSRALLFPLTLRTLNSTRRLQEIQPEIERIRKQYSDPRRQSEETLKLYRESGVNPLGCLGPQLLQFPLFIALYQVIRITLGNTPEAVGSLSGRLYNVDLIQNAVPLSTEFLFLDLSANGNIFLTVVVFCSMWLQQRISTARNASSSSSQQAQMNQMMQWMMPAIFAWFVLAVPAGLGLYWGASTIVGIVLQWFFVGPGDFEWASLIPNLVRAQVGMDPYIAPSDRRPAPRSAAAVAADDDQPASEEDSTDTGDDDEGGGNQRSNRRRGRRSRSRSTGTQSRSSRRRRRQRR